MVESWIVRQKFTARLWAQELWGSGTSSQRSAKSPQETRNGYKIVPATTLLGEMGVKF